MYKYNLILKNKSEWISYATRLLNGTTKSANEMLDEILEFPFEFDGVAISE